MFTCLTEIKDYIYIYIYIYIYVIYIYIYICVWMYVTGLHFGSKTISRIWGCMYVCVCFYMCVCVVGKIGKQASTVVIVISYTYSTYALVQRHTHMHIHTRMYNHIHTTHQLHGFLKEWSAAEVQTLKVTVHLGANCSLANPIVKHGVHLQ